MTLSLTPSKSAKWIRALFGGSLSALVVGIAFFLVYFVNSDLSKFVRILEIPGALLTLLVILLLGYPLASYEPVAVPLPIISLALVYWFLFGFVLTYFIKNNKMAIAWWLILVIIPGAVLQLLLNSMFSIFR